MDEPERQSLRANVRRLWLECLSDLANFELQQRWLNKTITNPHWSYIEFMSCYFDDLLLSGAGYGYERLIRDGFITAEEHHCVQDFHEALAQYKEPNGAYDPEAILKDPHWREIVALGRKSIDKLAMILTEADREILLAEPRVLEAGDFTWPNRLD
jgi:hypothetical protein